MSSFLLRSKERLFDSPFHSNANSFKAKWGNHERTFFLDTTSISFTANSRHFHATINKRKHRIAVFNQFYMSFDIHQAGNASTCTRRLKSPTRMRPSSHTQMERGRSNQTPVWMGSRCADWPSWPNDIRNEPSGRKTRILLEESPTNTLPL